MARVWLFAALAACGTGGEAERRGGERLAAPQARLLGEEAAALELARAPEETRPTYGTYLHCVAEAVTREASRVGGGEWDIHVVRSAGVDVLAVPGAVIVPTGVLRIAETPAQVATAISHAIGHVLAGHLERRVVRLARELRPGVPLSEALQDVRVRALILPALGAGPEAAPQPFDDREEREADRRAVLLMAMAGFDSRESFALWRSREAADAGTVGSPLHPAPAGGRAASLRAAREQTDAEEVFTDRRELDVRESYLLPACAPPIVPPIAAAPAPPAG